MNATQRANQLRAEAETSARENVPDDDPVGRLAFRVGYLGATIQVLCAEIERLRSEGAGRPVYFEPGSRVRPTFGRGS